MNKKITTDWDLKDLGKKYNDPKFLKERELHQKKINAFARKWKKDTSYLTDLKKLKKAVDEYNNLVALADSEGMYLFLMRQIDSGNTKLAAAEKKYIEFSQKLEDQIRFLKLSLGTIDENAQKKILADKDFVDYKNFLRSIFEKSKYTLSEKEEKILALKSGVSHRNWDSMVEEIFSQESREVLTRGKGSMRIKKQKTFTEIMSLIHDSCSRVRNSAAEAIEDILAKNALVVEKEFNSILENKKIDDELRGYERPSHARILSDNISFDIVDTMTEVVTENFKISRDYYALKTKLLKKNTLNYHERNVPVSKLDKDYSYEEALDLVTDSMNMIDPEFAQIHKNMYRSGKIDVYPKPGKRGGAFCMYHNKAEPVYIMLNYTGKSRDVATLAHEMGHAVHGTLAKSEIDLNYNTPMFMAEIASTFCEEFAFEEILKRSNEKEKLALYMQKIGDSISTISRQVAAYNFECEVHEAFREKGYLSSNEIGKIFKKHMKAYMGPKVLQNYGAENWWMYWHHFRSPFYVYSYASGLLIANGMRAILKKNPEKWPDLKKFFYTGTSVSPKEFFDSIGIDITDPVFWEAGLNEIRELLKKTKKIAKTLGSI